MSNYVLSGASWFQSTVSWYWAGNPSFYGEIAEAFAAWDAVIDLDFTQAASALSADVVLYFGAIDGPFGVLGEASYSYFPSTGEIITASIEFDSLENWTWSSSAGSYVLSSGTTFYEVAAHEIGHVLGLEHTTNPHTLMHPDSGGSATDLTYWDIYGARLIYGAEYTWFYGWYSEWTYGWHADWSYGWYDVWTYGWHQDWFWGWHLDWAWGWGGWTQVWDHGWDWSWDYGWDVTWAYGWYWYWDYGWDPTWSYGWYLGVAA